MQIIGIAGGSGSGKSTVSYKLVDTYPDTFEVLNLDDYQKFKSESDLPRVDGMINWDHPGIFRWTDLLADIKTLQKGLPVTIKTWSHRSNPNYFKHGKMIPRTMIPRKILIIDGYFALWNKDLRKQYTRSYYLDLDISDSIKRRKKFENSKYETKVIIPMHKKYIEPTKKYADKVLDVSSIKEEEVYKKIEKDINKFFFSTI